MVTIKEIAEYCHVSITTVSKVLNGKPKVGEETRQHILQVAKEMGYQPNYLAQGLRSQKTRTIGVIVEDINLLSTPGIIDGIMEYCEKKDYRIILQNLRLYARWGDKWFGSDEIYQSVLQPALQELTSIKVDGMLYVAGHARKIACFPKDMEIPAVMAYAYADTEGVPSVVIDDEKASYEMMEELINAGHSKIGIIGGRQDNLHTINRIAGCQKALFDHEILYNPGYIKYADWDREDAYDATKNLIEQDVTAIFCFSDQMAGGVYDYCREHDITVGKDISVAGFDNYVISQYLSPALTTMALPLNEIGYTAAMLLVDGIESDEVRQLWASENVIKQASCKIKLRKSIHEIL